MSSLTVPTGRGAAARMLADLNAEHAPPPSPGAPSPTDIGEADEEATVTNVTTLQRSNERTIAPTHEASNEGTNLPANADAHVETPVPSHEGAPAGTNGRRSARKTERVNVASSPPANSPTNPPTTASTTADSEQNRRFERAMEIAKQEEAAGNIAVVTLRVPAKLAKYMDDYVARINQIDPKRRLRKQDAAAKAFAAFYAEHPMPPAPDEDL